MYTLFNEPLGGNVSTVRFPEFDYVKKAHLSNLDRVISHYRRSARAVESDHLFVQLLQAIPIPVETELGEYMNRVREYEEEIIRPFSLTSPGSVGKAFFPGVLYGERSEEIFILDESSFDLGLIRNQWEESSPLRFLRHPFTDLNLAVPMGTPKTNEHGLTVVSLNLVKLACQYRQWRLREKRLNAGQQGTIMQFVARYPLINSLRSQQDVAFFNLIRATFKGEKIEEQDSQHAFFFNPRFEKTVDAVKELVDTYMRRQTGFAELLEVIEPITESTLRDVVALPDIAPTRQVIWSLVAARLPLIAFLLQWNEVTDGQKSNRVINQIKRNVRRMKNDRAINDMVGRDTKDNIERFLEMEIQPYL